MKVLHICTYDFGGAGLCCLRIHESMLKMGIESKMVVMRKTQNAPEEYKYGLLRQKIFRIPSKLLRVMGLVITDWNAKTSLSAQYHTVYTLPVSSVDMTKFKWVEWADIIHLHWVNDYLDYPSFFKKNIKPIIWTLHDENLFYGIAHLNKSLLPNHPLEKKYKKIKYEAVCSSKDLTVVFLSQMMYQKFSGNEIIEGRRKFVINNFVDTEMFKPIDRLLTRKKYGFDINKIIFVFVSYNIADPNKGLSVLSEVLWQIDHNIEILAIGDNPKQKKWPNVKGVGLIKDQTEMRELLSCANYMAMPSYQEAFPLSPMEAMSCGIPVVAFPVSGTSELINNNNGVVCDDFTSDALRKGVEALMNHKYDDKEIRKDMINRFSSSVIINKYVNLYNEVLG